MQSHEVRNDKEGVTVRHVSRAVAVSKKNGISTGDETTTLGMTGKGQKRGCNDDFEKSRGHFLCRHHKVLTKAFFSSVIE